MKDKKLILALIALIALAAVMLGIWWFHRPQPKDSGSSTTTTTATTTPGGTTDPTATTAPTYAKTITVTVIHGDGSEKVFTYGTNEDYLGTVLVAEGLVQGDNSTYGLMIHTVDGETADWNVNQSYWALYIGEDYAMTGADTTPIGDGDTFKLVYTIG